MNKNGIGLGLHISKNIVHQFGGSMNFESQEGTGSVFKFNFMLEYQADHDPEMIENQQRSIDRMISREYDSNNL